MGTYDRAKEDDSSNTELMQEKEQSLMQQMAQSLDSDVATDLGMADARDALAKLDRPGKIAWLQNAIDGEQKAIEMLIHPTNGEAINASVLKLDQQRLINYKHYLSELTGVESP